MRWIPERLRWRLSLRLVGHLSSNPLFDTEWYLAHYPDVRENRIDPYIHYWSEGAREGRDPNAIFDTDWYVAQYPDVAEADINPLDHYLVFGCHEGREPCPRVVADWYLQQYADVPDGDSPPMVRKLSQTRARSRQRGRLSPTSNDGPRVAGCTIIARNYLSHARILANSFLRHHPGSSFYLLVVDGLPAGVQTGPGYTLVHPDELGLGYFAEMCFKYDITELSTAVKPTLLAFLMEKYGEHYVTYLDPDILVMRPLAEMNAAVALNDITLIPHLLSPIPLDGLHPSEQDILIAGAYNLGFIGVRRNDRTLAFLRWWEERLRDHCRKSPADGLMVDQRWIDLVPALFPGTTLLRDYTYNVAYWNLNARDITYDDGMFLCNGRPLAFFHFSGFDPRQAMTLSKHQDRVTVEPDSALAHLLALYAELQWGYGYAESAAWEYGYGRLTNSVPVHSILRALYGGLPQSSRVSVGNPFEAEHDGSLFRWATIPSDSGLSPFLERVYAMRPDVASAFPEPRGKDHERFLEWARRQGATEMGYDPAYASPPAAHRPLEPSHDVVTAANQRSLHDGQPFAPDRTTAPVAITHGVNVVGYLRNESGVGAAARGYVRALRSMGVPVSIVDVSELSPNRSRDDSLDLEDGGVRHSINLVAVNADQHFHVAAHLGDNFFNGRYTIGVWQWELPYFPEEWRDRFEYYDEIWAGSSFIVDALAPTSPIPVLRIPPPLVPPKRGSRERGRERVGVTAEETLFVFAFDFHSYFERKNPIATINAFRQAFAPDESVRLVIKCANHEFDPNRLESMLSLAKDHRVSVYAGYWPSEEIDDLMAACDVYVSLHRSEGIGLTIAHSMALGKPVIATGWSGSMDFVSVANAFPVRYELVQLEEAVGPYAAGQIWAEPSVDHAAELMRWVYENRTEAASRGERAASDIARLFSEESAAKTIGERLAVLEQRQAGLEQERFPINGSYEDAQRTTGGKRQEEELDRMIDEFRAMRAADAARVSEVETAVDEIRQAATVHELRSREVLRRAARQAMRAAERISGQSLGKWDQLASEVGSLRAAAEEIRKELNLATDSARAASQQVAELAPEVEDIRASALETSAALRQVTDSARELWRRFDSMAPEVAALTASVQLHDGRATELGSIIEEIRRELKQGVDNAAERSRQFDALMPAVETLRDSTEEMGHELMHRSESQADLLRDLADKVKRVERRFTIRPYMAFDAFGTLNDLGKPMAYDQRSPSDEHDGQPRFEDIFRGSEDFISDRQRVYLPFFIDRARIVDLGCGRGEFLSLLAEAGVNAVGVDVDAALVERCATRGLAAVQGDALDYLKGLEPSSLDGIFTAQMIEHLDTTDLTRFLALAKAALQHDGLLVAETINPESFEALKTFHVDLTHQRPIFPQVLLHLCRDAGFRTARIFYPLGGGFTQISYDTAGEYAVVAEA